MPDASSSDGFADRPTASFTTTKWNLVLAAGDTQCPEAAEALEQLCRTYWYPLYAYVRRCGHDAEESRDLTQEFFARLLERRDLAGLDPLRGRFRSFLLASMNHFLANEWHRARAQKRGGGQPILPLDTDAAESRYRLEPVDNATPETIYQKHWALGLFEQALGALRQEQVAADNLRRFEALKEFLSCEPDEGDYAAVATGLGMTSGAVATAVHRLRDRYRELVRTEILRTLDSPADLDDELRCIIGALG